jgi:hypothetical protein
MLLPIGFESTLNFFEPQIYTSHNGFSGTSPHATIRQISSQQSASLPARQSTSHLGLINCQKFYKESLFSVIVERPCLWINISSFGVPGWFGAITRVNNGSLSMPNINKIQDRFVFIVWISMPMSQLTIAKKMICVL